MASVVTTVVVLSQRAVIDTFMRSDAVRPAEAILFEPNGTIQRSFFDGLTRSGIIKPEGARWYLDVPAYSAAKRKRRYRTLVAGGIVAAVAAVLAMA